MALTAAAAIRKCITTRDAVKKTEALLDSARRTHRAAILAAAEVPGLAQREIARRLDVSEVVLREKLSKAKAERA